MTFIQAMKLPTLFLPAYSPNLAPVEIYFATLKMNLKLKTEDTHVNYMSPQSNSVIQESI